MKNSVILGGSLITAGIVFLFTGWAKNLVAYFFGLVLLADSGLWLMNWLRSQNRTTMLKDNFFLFLGNGLKITFALILFFYPKKTINEAIFLCGVSLLIWSVYQFFRLKNNVSAISPLVMRLSIFANALITIASLILTINYELIASLFNIILSSVFIISGFFVLMSNKQSSISFFKN